ncbi:hypothetical protein AXE65_00840 [Ventosimonas gracilis]|uniref:Replication-associated protein G2P N-terminal domain-containing protein n=1 Tax=Ventosimonas gracilis TaxID=1680762 RepID=A0A139SVT5_9GAMM|nr:phage/plasmid replication protein, II/X family [Ventosimonas gracilis]KXU38705.1 hypothetical protein AXE65_00840 [Ventosimonas gracilis]
MIDWVSCFLPIIHPRLYAGEVIALNPDKTIEWSCERKLQVHGSWSSQIMVKSVGSAPPPNDANGRPDYSAPPLATHLYIQGNPAKWLQGHNIVGTDNLLELMLDTFDLLCEHLNLMPTDFERHNIKKGQYRLTRIDYNRMFDLPSRSDVQAWLRAAEFKAKSRHGRPLYNRGTLSFGSTSRHWKVVCYCKADEIQTKRSSKVSIEEIQLTSDAEFKRWIDNKLRVELRLLSRKLKDTTFDGRNLTTEFTHPENRAIIEHLTLQWAYNLTPEKLKTLFNEYVGGLDMSEQIELNSEQVLKLPNKLRGTYTLWKEGHDLKSILSNGTYYNHRKDLKEYGIDIAIRCDRAVNTSNVVPLIRILEAKPAGIPAFFFERGLVHRSARADY